MLKYIALLASLVIGLNKIKADCGGNYLLVYPTNDTIPKNSVFILEGYAMSQKVIDGLNKEYPVYLESSNKKIKLLVKEILVGEFLLTQAIMRPEFPLEKGIVYTLKIDNLPPYERLQKYDYATKKYKPITFVASDLFDTLSPVIHKNPVEIRKDYHSFGCGPAKAVVFDCPVSDTSDVLVRTTVKSMTTGKSTTYILTTAGNQIAIGHGMCSGEFDFPGEGNFEVTFVFMDQCGNFTKATPAVQITEPTPADYKED